MESSRSAAEYCMVWFGALVVRSVLECLRWLIGRSAGVWAGVLKLGCGLLMELAGLESGWVVPSLYFSG